MLATTRRVLAPAVRLLAAVRCEAEQNAGFDSRREQRGSVFGRRESCRSSSGALEPKLSDDHVRLGANALRQENRRLERLTLATMISIMNKALRNSEGTSIIVRRLARAKAEDKEGYRCDGAARAVNSENIQSLGLHASQPSGVKF